MADAVNELIQKLESASWFSAVGTPVASVSKTINLSSWEEVYSWSENAVVAWCSVEAKKQLYETLSSTHYDRFKEWTTIAKANLPHVEQIMKEHVLPAAPKGFSDKAAGRIQAQIVGALMELAYRDCVPLDLCQSLVQISLTGHFACGWYVDRPEQFPDGASIVVF